MPVSHQVSAAMIGIAGFASASAAVIFGPEPAGLFASLGIAFCVAYVVKEIGARRDGWTVPEPNTRRPSPSAHREGGVAQKDSSILASTRRRLGEGMDGG